MRLRQSLEVAPGRSRFWRNRAIALVIVVAALWLGAKWQTRHHLSGAPPPTTLASLDGEPVALSSLRGKPTLIAFWAPWCGVCKAESQNIAWARKLVGRRANIVSVATAYENLDSVKAFVKDHGVDYPVLLGNDGVIQDFHVTGFPTLYFLDADGTIRRSTFGYTTTLGLLLRLWI
jgi:thiol-disulfide isomerase/thioredoxin